MIIPARSAHSVSVCVDISCNIKIDHCSYVRNVETSSRNVCGHQDRKLLLFKSVDNLVTLVLNHAR